MGSTPSRKQLEKGIGRQANMYSVPQLLGDWVQASLAPQTRTSVAGKPPIISKPYGTCANETNNDRILEVFLQLEGMLEGIQDFAF